MPFVLDNSVAAGWYLANQATPYTQAIADRLLADRAVVPVIWELELANVLRTTCLRQRMAAPAAQQVVAQLLQLPISVDREPVGPAALLALSLRHGLNAYDAAYLELALRLQLSIATADAALADAAMAAGVSVVA